jgi:MFS family permease
VLALSTRRLRSGGLAAIFTALVGTVLWFGLIIYDGSHNPATAMYAPDRVHTAADVDFEGGTVVLAANILFPLGYVLLGVLLRRYGRRWTGLLLGFGGVVYALGGTVSLFGLGPHSMITSVVEIVGAAPFALGYVLLGRASGQLHRSPGDAVGAGVA